MTNGLILAVDLGTSGIKVAAVDRDLRIHALSAVRYPTHSRLAGQAEQLTSDWVAGLNHAIGSIRATITRPIEAISLTGQMPTLVPTGPAGEPVGPAVTWQDSRADALVEQQLTQREKQYVAEISGAPVDGRYLIPMELQRMKRGEAPSAYLLSAKDYLFASITGHLVTDPSTASGYGCYDLEASDWSDTLLALWSYSREHLPRIRRAVDFEPSLPDALPGLASGTPVVVGSADSVCSHQYLASSAEANVTINDGSSTVILAKLNDLKSRPKNLLVTPLVTTGQFAVEMDLLATGLSVDWLARICSCTIDKLEMLALTHPAPAAMQTVFLPYLAGGEQGALWRSDLTGTISGISAGTGVPDLALALFEGITFETLRCLRHLGPNGAGPLVVAGVENGLNVNHAILDAIWPWKVLASTSTQPTLLGAAMIGFEALGIQVTAGMQEKGQLPRLNPDYINALPSRAEHYLNIAPGSTLRHNI